MWGQASCATRLSVGTTHPALTITRSPGLGNGE
jgi:hypothetical protein